MFTEVYKSNKKFWEKENISSPDKGILLYENIDDTPQLCYGISKIALCIAKAMGLRPAVLMPWRNGEMTASMCQMQFQIKNRLPIILVCNLIPVLYILLFLNKERLLSFKVGKDEIGTYIYDSILRRMKRKTVERLSLRDRMFICLEFCYYKYFKYLIKKYPIKVMVLGDSVYRYGLLYEICKNNGIVCFSPINLNTVFIRRFESEEDFRSNYLSKELLRELCKNNDYRESVDEYYKGRYAGNIQQHDVLTAYANKLVRNSDEFIKRYKLNPQKKTVIIMSHVFADAPHVYTDALYNDYWEWFVTSFRCLQSNKNINVLVKEHPSAHLYGQKGLINEFLKKQGLECLAIDDDESTLSILNNVDAVVTCGGTIGVEISYFGKYVVLASKPPYSGLGFSIDFSEREKYECYLRTEIQNIEKLTEEQRLESIKAAYAMFCRSNNWNDKLELGGEIIYMGRNYNNEKFSKNIIAYNRIPLCEQNIYKLIERFVKSNHRAMFSSQENR